MKGLKRKAEKRQGARILMEPFKPRNSTIPDASWGYSITSEISNKTMIFLYKIRVALA